MAVNSVSASNYYTQAALSSPVSVSVALAALKVNPVAKIQISDSTENISRNLDTLTKYANNLTQITQLDPTQVMKTTSTQFSSYTKLLAKFTTNYQFNVSDATATLGATLAANSHVSSLSIKDTGANVNLKLNTLQTMTNPSKLSQIVLTNPSVPMSMTAAQYAANSTALSKMVGNYNLSITGADAATAIGYANKQFIKSVSILDTAANISTNLDGLVQLGVRIKEVRGSDNNPIDVNASQLLPDSLVIGKLYSGYQLNVHGADMNMSQLLVFNKKVSKIDVVDTAANISTKIALLGSLGSHVNSIHVTDVPNKLQLTSDQFGQYSGVLGKILAGDAYKVDVQQATAAEAQALVDDARVDTVAVKDNAQAISVAIDDLKNNAKLTGISITGSSQMLSLSYAQLSADASAIAKVNSNYSLNVTDTDADKALSLTQSNARVAKVEVKDTTSHLLTSIDDLASLGSRLSKVTDTDTSALTMTASHWKTLQNTLGKIVGGYNVNLTEVKASEATALVADGRVQTVSVKDTAAAITKNLDALNALGTQLSALEPTDGSTVALTATQLSNDTTAVGKFANSILFNVTSASASQVTSLTANTKVSAIAIKDSSANIALNLDAIQTAMDGLDLAHRTVPITVAQTGVIAPLSLTATQLTNDAKALLAITGNYSLKVSAVTASNANTVANNSHVSSLVIEDIGSAITGKLSDLSALGNKVSSVVQTDLSSDLELTLPQWTSYATLFRKFQNGVHANISGVSSAQALSLIADSRIDHVAVSDKAAQISAKFDTLQSLGPKLSSVTLTDSPAVPVQLTMQQYVSDAALVGKINNGTFYVKAASAQDAQTLLGNGYANVTALDVTDTSANVGSLLDQLSTNTKLQNIRLSDATQPISITAQKIRDDAAGLGKIVGSYSLNVTDATTTNAATLASNSKVVSMQVSGSTANFVAKLSDLVAANSKISSISLSDAPSTIALTYSQWVAAQPVIGKISSNFKISVSEVSAANASQVAGDVRVSSLALSDSAVHVQNNLDALNSIHPKISLITLSDSPLPATLTITGQQYGSDANVLGKLAANSFLLNVTAANVDQAQVMKTDATVAHVSVLDSSENIASSLADLNANSKLSAVVNSTPTFAMSITGALYTSSATTFANTNAYQLNVTDALGSIASALDANAHVDTFTLSDSSTAIGSAITASPALSDKLLSLSVTSDTGPMVLTQAQLNDFSGNNSLINTLSKVQGDYHISLTGVTTDNLDLLSSGDLVLNPSVSHPFAINNSKITSISVADSSQNVSLSFDQLLGFGSKLSAVTLSVASAPIALTPSQLSNGSSLLSKISGGTYHLAMIDVHVDDAATLAALSTVDSIGILDTASVISTRFADLQSIESKIQSINASDHAVIELTSAQYASTLSDKIFSSKSAPTAP